MDKALAWHTGGQCSNLDTTKFNSAPIHSGTLAMCTLSVYVTMTVVMCSSVNTCHKGGKKRGNMVKS